MLRRTSSGAISAYTQVKMEDAPKLMKIPKSECPDIWIRLPRHKWPKSWSSMEDPVVPLERYLCGRPLAGLSWERQFEKIPLKYGSEKVSNWECLFVHREKGLFLSVYVDDIKLAGNSAKADTQSSEPRVHCLEVSSKAKAVENCRFTIVPIWKRLKLFFALLFL